VMDAGVVSGSVATLSVIHFALSPIIRGPMFAFACIAGGLIVVCSVFALLVPSGPEVTLSDIARQMETMHRSGSIRGSGIPCLKTGAKQESPGQVKGRKLRATQAGTAD
jgi:hypothetical protein